MRKIIKLYIIIIPLACLYALFLTLCIIYSYIKKYIKYKPKNKGHLWIKNSKMEFCCSKCNTKVCHSYNLGRYTKVHNLLMVGTNTDYGTCAEEKMDRALK